MNTSTPFLSLNINCEEALTWLKSRLEANRLRVLQTFDLHSARLAFEDCPCPNHGTRECDCQMVVLLVYAKAFEPATLILHGHDGQTWISLVNNSSQRIDPAVRSSIEQTLQISLSE